MHESSEDIDKSYKETKNRKRGRERWRGVGLGAQRRPFGGGGI